MRRLLIALVAVCLQALPVASVPADLPQRLTDQEFWQLSTDLSEPGGNFASDNLVSNEEEIPKMAAALRTRATPGGVYLGVGPEQNFTYMSAARPRMAFIVDIRRGNLQLQLLYKALFELSADRADFVSRLFTKKRPAELGPSATAAQLVNTYWAIYTSDEASFRANATDVLNALTVRHGLPLSEDDRTGIENIYRAFYWYGPRITWSAKTWPASTVQVGLLPGALLTWADLMMLADESGLERSFLATEEQYRFVKQLEERNLVVPAVGDFAGPKALRAVGDYVRRRGAIVNVFYGSNVEEILHNMGRRPAFCANAATLPVDDTSLLVRMGRLLPIAGPYTPGQTAISYRPGGARSITINGKELPGDQVAAYFAQPTADVVRIREAVKRCVDGR